MRKVIKLKNEMIAVAIVLILMLAVVFAPLTISVANDYIDKKVVVLDAGHGGDDGGVVGVKTRVKESEINLYMALIVGEYLSSMGFDVVYTRKNSDDLSGGVFKKRTDMDKRLEIISSANPVAVVSLHMNSYPISSRRGAQVFYYKQSNDSKIFADIMQSQLNDDFNFPDLNKRYKALTAEKYLLWHTSQPIIIVECGFLSNEKDESNFLDSDYRHKFAYSVCQGIATFVADR